MVCFFKGRSTFDETVVMTSSDATHQVYATVPEANKNNHRARRFRLSEKKSKEKFYLKERKNI